MMIVRSCLLLAACGAMGVQAVECGNACPNNGNFDPDAITEGITCQAYLDTTEFGSITCPLSLESLTTEEAILEEINTDMMARGCCEKGYTTSCEVCPTKKINENEPFDAEFLGSAFEGVVDCGTLVDNRQALQVGRVSESNCLFDVEYLTNRPVPCCECDDTLLDCAAIAASRPPTPSPATLAPTPSNAFHTGGMIVSVGVAAVLSFFV